MSHLDSVVHAVIPIQYRIRIRTQNLGKIIGEDFYYLLEEIIAEESEILLVIGNRETDHRNWMLRESGFGSKRLVIP